MLVHRAVLFREGLGTILERDHRFELVARCACEDQTIEKVGQLQPDVILLDAGKRGTSWWVEAGQRMNELAPRTKIILLTYPRKAIDPVLILKSGARAFIDKDALAEELISAIIEVHLGNLVILPPNSNKILEAFGLKAAQSKTAESDYLVPLTRQEKRVLTLVAECKTNKEIGEALLISERTVKEHLRWIMTKLHVHNRAQIVALALGKGAGNSR
jgi:DNA-binding NarL/FixJ family response regulator